MDGVKIDIQRLMQSVAASSADAAALVDDLKTNHATELNKLTVENLQQRVNELRAQVSELQSRIRDGNVTPLSDDDRTQIYHQLEKRLASMTLDNMRSAYSEAGLRELDSDEMRFLVCRALCSELEARQIPIDSIWVDTLVRKGSL